MANAENIKMVIENAPRLYFTSTSDVVWHENGQRVEMKVQVETDADYAQKSARREVTTVQYGKQVTITAVFKDNEVIICSSGEDGRELQKKESMSQEEFEKLFLPTGFLRPISMEQHNIVQEQTGNNQVIMEMAGEPAPSIPGQSNLIMQVCSEDTIRINSLVSAQSEETDGLVMTDTEILVHVP